MSPQFSAIVRLLQEEEETSTAAETSDVDVVCSNQGPVCEVLYEWTDNELFAEATSFIIGVPIKIILIGVGALILNRFLRKSIEKAVPKLGVAARDHGDSVVSDRSVDRADERASTITSLLRSMSTALVFGTAGVLMLEAVGISVIAAIAGAGVLGLAVGFGAQSVVEDLLRGLFMLAEDQFGVGDRIDVGSVNGTVERVTARTVVIRDPEGTLWHVPNSEIDWVANEAQKSSRATVDIGVGYSIDLDEAMTVLQSAAEDAADDEDWEQHVQQPPEVKGVQELGDDAVIIRVIVWVDAGKRRAFERYLRQRLKEALDAEGLEMPNRTLDVWMRGDEAA